MAPSETKAKSNCCSSSSATTTLSRKRKKSSSKCLISISSTWYSLFVVLIHIYLIKTHIETILDLKPLGQTHDTINQTMANNLFTLLRQEVDEALSSELIVRVLSVSISLLFLSLFVLASLQRCANYANDSVKFGRDFFAEQLHHHRKHISYDKAKSPTSKTSNDSGRGTTTAESSSDSASSISSTSIKRKRRGCRCITGLRRLGEHMWRHFLPFAPLAHILSVVILILPDLVYPAVHSVRDRIDRAYANTSDCFRQEGFINAENAFNISRASNCIVDVFFKPNSGLLSKFLTSAAVNTTTSNDLYKEYFFDQIRIYAIEIISLSLAFATLSIRYGSVFWYTNKTLSYIITLIGFVSSVQQLFQLYAFSYLNQQITTIRFERVVKMFLSELLVSSKMPTRADLNALESRMSFKLTPFSYFSSQPASMTASNSSLLTQDYDEMFIINSRLKLVFTYAVLGALVILTLIPAYAFVYLKYKERFLLEEAHFLSALLNEHQHLAKPSASQHTTVLRRSETSASKIRQCDDEIRFDQMSLLTDETNKFEPCKLIWDENKMLGGGEVENGATTLALALELNKSGCCFNYCPHLIATIQLILICLCKLPFCYDFIMYFEMSTQKDFGIMLCIIIEILHTVVLLFIWLLLTLKTEWSMHLRASYSICHWTYHLRHHHMQRRRLRRQSTSTNEHQVSSSSATFTNIQTSEKVVIKGDENSRSMEMSMKLTQEPIQSKRCSLAREDHFDNSVDDEDDDYRNQTTIVSHQHLHNNTSNDQSVVAASFRRIGATATNTTSSTSSEDLLASETMYRNQIRKSIRNVLQHKRNSAIAIPIVNENGCESMRTTNRYHFQPQPQFKIISPPSIQSSTITSNGRAVQPVARLLGTGVYLTTSPSFAAESSASNNGQFLTTASTPKPLQPHQQHPSAPTITTILTSSVFEIPPQQQSQSVLYLNRPHSKEYESRV